MDYEIGDRILCNGYDGYIGKGTICEIRGPNDVVFIRDDSGNRWSCGNAGVYIRKIQKPNKSIMSSLKEKMALVFKGEPQKSFIKAGVMNVDETLTADGQQIFLAWLVKKNGDAFKTEVVDPILAEEEK